jgi:hypothetical protein
MTNIYMVQPDDYDSNPPRGVYTSIQSALVESITIEQYDFLGHGLNIYWYTVDQPIALEHEDDTSASKPVGLEYVDRRIAHVSSVNRIVGGKLPEPTIIVKLNNIHCTELNLSPTIVVGDVAKEYGFKISKMTIGDESVVFELTEDAK